MVDLDPEEERLLAEAMYETADDDLGGPLLEITEYELDQKDGENVPKSKVQFPIRRSKHSRKRKVIFALTLLASICGACILAYFLLSAKTISFELQLNDGQVLHYRLTQEHTFEGLTSIHASFAEDVFVRVVNKTDNLCWLNIALKTLPNLRNGPYVFLVSVNLGGQKSIDIEDENRLKVFTPWQKNSTLDYYVLNLMTQLLPVVKIDLFEMILSQISTRKHEVVLENSKFFAGDATMKQNIRVSKDEILITSKILPQGFSSFGGNTNKKSPHLSLTFEEDTSISKETGMLKSSDLELTGKVPLSGQNSKSKISMRFKSSLRLSDKEEVFPTVAKAKYYPLSKILTPAKYAVKYSYPTVKEYNEKTNVVNTVKAMLNISIHQDFGHKSTNKDMEAFAKSFHAIAKPGIETNFEELKEKSSRRIPKHKSTTPAPTTIPRDQTTRPRDEYDDDMDDEDDTFNDDDDNQARGGSNQYGFGQPPPLFPDDEDYDYGDEDGSESESKMETERKKAKKAPQSPHSTAKNSMTNKNGIEITKERKSFDSKALRDNKKEKVLKATKITSKALYKAAKKEMEKNKRKKAKKEKTMNTKTTKRKTKKVKTSKVNKAKKIHSANKNNEHGKMRNSRNETMKSTENNLWTENPFPEHQEKNFFDRIFDQLWKDDDSASQSEEPDKKTGGFFSNLFPSFSFSSDFPFIHVTWDKSNSSKNSAIESMKRKRREIHRDKRRLYSEGESYYTSRDLEPIWDTVSRATIKEHPKQTSVVFQQTIFGLDVVVELQHEIKVPRSTANKWEILISLMLSVDKHQFRVLNKVISLKDIEERFLKNAKPKLEYGTIHGGTLVLCSPLFYIENVCVEIRPGFVLHVSHTIEYITKEYPIELSIFFKNLAKVDVTMSSHMTSLLGTHGVFGHGPLFGAKIPLEIRFTEDRESAKWCSIASLKSKTGDFFEGFKDMNQWSCPINTAIMTQGVCEGMYRNITRNHKTTTKLWYDGLANGRIHFMNNC